VVRDVRERGTGFDIANCINARHVCFQPFVNFYIAFLVHLYAGGPKIEMIRVGPPTRGDQQMGTLDRAFAAITADCKLNLTLFASLNPARIGFESYIDSIFCQNVMNLYGHIAVLARQELLPPLNDRDLAAITAKHLAKLNGDVAAAHDQE